MIIYLIRHSSPFVDIANYEDYINSKWCDYNRNMILSVEGEEKAKKLCNIKELQGINNIYSSDSFRAISTAKYLANLNNTKIKLDPRINERELGIKYLKELPDKFNEISFNNKDYKLRPDGESLNEVDTRLNSFINDILQLENDKTIVVIHGIMLLSFLANVCEFSFNDKKVFAKFKDKVIIDEKPKSPGVYKITYQNNKIIDIDVLN